MATKKSEKTAAATAGPVKVVDEKKAMAALDKIRKRDSDLLKRLAR